MKTKQTRGLQAFRRVTAWFADHPDVIANSGSSAAALGSQVDALKQIVASMTARATEQTTQAGQATLAAKDEATQRHDVRSLHLGAIVKVAGALRGKVPGMGVFKLPSRKMASETLVHTAQALHTTAAIYKDVFVEHGLPADFLEQLDVATVALKSSVDARGVAQSRRVGATTGLSEDLALGRQIVTMIDASLTHALKTDSATLASWRQAKRATVKGAVPRAISGAAPGAVSVASPAVAGGSGAAAAVPAVVASGPVAGSGVPAVSSQVPTVSNLETPVVSTVPAGAPQESRAA
jgi:hypothetical protein